ncbi:hypothetical protein FRC04_000034 [Tulasnella sp. 424]|nr:hypothetical protein FRC04_000034 [Tulasnella sp. 424]
MYSEDGIPEGLDEAAIVDEDLDPHDVFEEETAGVEVHPASTVQNDEAGDDPAVPKVLLEAMGVSDPEGDKIPSRMFEVSTLRNIVSEDSELPDLVIARGSQAVTEYKTPAMFPESGTGACAATMCQNGQVPRMNDKDMCDAGTTNLDKHSLACRYFSASAMFRSAVAPSRQLLHRSTCKTHIINARRLPTQQQARHFSPITALGDQILSVGNVLSQVPLPEFIGPYTAGIVLSTLAIRTAVTLPVFFWTRKRVARQRDIVIPKIIEWRKPFAAKLAAEAKTKPNPKEWFESEFKTAAIAYRAQLLKEHKCQPFYTALATPLTLIPTIVLTSLAIRSICVMPDTPLYFEKFLSDVPLALPDATGFFPLAVGMLSLTSLELARKFARERAGEFKESEWAKQHVKKNAAVAAAGKKNTGGKQTVSTLVQSPSGKWEVVQTTARPKAPKDTALDKMASQDKAAVDPEISRFSKISGAIGRGGAVLMIGVSMWSPGTFLGRWYDKRFAARASLPPSQP